MVRRSRFPANAHNLIAYHWLNTVMQSRRADYGRRIDTAAGQLRVACLARLSREERSVVAEVTYQLKLTRGQTRCAKQNMFPCDLNERLEVVVPASQNVRVSASRSVRCMDGLVV